MKWCLFNLQQMGLSNTFYAIKEGTMIRKPLDYKIKQVVFKCVIIVLLFVVLIIGIKIAIHFNNFSGTKNLYIIKALLMFDPSFVNKKNSKGFTPLHWAVLNNSINIASLLLGKNADCDAKNNFGSTPLHYAALNGSAEMVQLLLSNKADINVKDNDNKTPLHYVVDHNNIREDIINKLCPNYQHDLECGLDISVESLQFIKKIKYNLPHSNYQKVLTMLLANHANVDAKTKEGYTPLTYAALEGEKDQVLELLNNHASVKDEDKESPLTCAISGGNIDIVKILLNHNVNVNIQREYNWTPLLDALKIKKYKNGRLVAQI